MFIAAWEFVCKPQHQSRFLQAYGADGDWVRLFRQHPGFLRTECMQDAENPYRYIVLDYWATPAAYDDFRKTFRQAYLELDARCETLTEVETCIGRFCSANQRD